MGFPTCSSVSERALPEVGVNTATGDVLIAPHSLRRVTRGLPTRDEHRRLNVEITPSVQQRRNVIPGFAHARLAVSVDRSPRWSVFGRWWERLLDDVIDDDNPHVEQLGGISRRSGHVTCDDKVPRFECVYELPLKPPAVRGVVIGIDFVVSMPSPSIHLDRSKIDLMLFGSVGLSPNSYTVDRYPNAQRMLQEPLFQYTHVEADLVENVVLRPTDDTETYPSGWKCTLHLCTLDGLTLVRYDNSHEDTKGNEHHTTAGDRDDIKLPGIEDRLVEFWASADEYWEAVGRDPPCPH